MHLEILRSYFPGLLTDIFFGTCHKYFILSKPPESPILVSSPQREKAKVLVTDSEGEASDTGLKWVIYGPFLNLPPFHEESISSLFE